MVSALPWVVVGGVMGNGRWVEVEGGELDPVTGQRSAQMIRVAALSVEADPQLLADGERRMVVLPERMEAVMALVEPGEVDFILWPESPTGTSEPPWELDAALRWSRALETPILFGALEGPDRRNRLLRAWPDSHVERLREKRRLVPMVESRPPGPERVSTLTFPLPARGRTGEQVEAGDQVGEQARGGYRVMAGALICFEALFGGEGRALRRHGAQVLLLPSNEGWLAGSGAGWNDAARSQHGAAAALRAVELAVPVVRSAVGGSAGVWDAAGREVQGDLRTVAGMGSMVLAEIPAAARRVPTGSAGLAAGVALLALLVLLSGMASRVDPVEAG